MRDWIIWDVDGVIADNRHRLHLIADDREGGKDWEEYRRLASNDLPISPMRLLYRALHYEASVAIVTGRMETERSLLVRWLQTYHFPQPDEFWMRAEGDYRPAPEIKREVLREFRLRHRIVLTAFDDHPGVIQAYRETEGLMPALQVVGYR